MGRAKCCQCPVRGRMHPVRSAVVGWGSYSCTTASASTITWKRCPQVRRSTVPLPCRGHFPHVPTPQPATPMSAPLRLPADRAATRLPLARDIAAMVRGEEDLASCACCFARERHCASAIATCTCLAGEAHARERRQRARVALLQPPRVGVAAHRDRESTKLATQFTEEN